jgi:hypothetical protein
VNAFPLREAWVVQLLLGLCVLVLLWGPGAVSAQPLEAHAFEIRGGEVVLSDGLYQLDADIDFELSPAARDALDSGVPLAFELRIELIRPRWLWLDETVTKLTQRYRVRYHALSDRYVLTNLNTGESRNFSTRASVLRALGTIRALPVIDQRQLRPGEEYQLWLRAGLDVDDLPPPLKTGAYLSPQWRLLSEWHMWRFRA